MATAYTADARFVVSGSDEGNLRIWKAHASERLGVVDSRERAAMEYRESLRARWAADAEVSRIARSHRVPKAVENAAKLKRTMLDAQKVKEDRRRRHTKAGQTKPKAERQKVVIVEQN